MTSDFILAALCGGAAILNYKLGKNWQAGICIACMFINIVLYLSRGNV